MKLANLDLIFKKPLLLNKLSFHPLSCGLGLPQALFQFLKKLTNVVCYIQHAHRKYETENRSTLTVSVDYKKKETCIEKLEIHKLTEATPAHVADGTNHASK